MSPLRGVLLTTACGGLLAASPAAAGELSEPPPEPQGIYGGAEVDSCAWPTAVGVTGGNSLCTGTLVSPWLVVYAAHCGGGTKKIRFGEFSSSPSKSIEAACQTYPAYGGVNDQAHDWAYCVLNSPVRDLPITPVLYGCETSVLNAGEEVAIVGFGANNGDAGAGRKRWATTTLNGVGSMTASLGGGGKPSVCPGDSGGPAFIQTADGVWRAFGIASTVTGSCGGSGTHALIHQAVDWIEEDSGYDITPCFDSGGVWNPTFDCGGFFMGGEIGYGTWTNWCPGTPASGSGNTCGQPFDDIPDNDPPLVQITSPMDGAEFVDEIPAKIPIEVATDDGDGWGVKSVRFKVNGEEQPVEDFDPPFAFNGAAFPEGVWTLQAIAEDAAGLIGESPEVTIIVGDPPAVTGGEETTGGEGTTGDDGGTSAGTGGTGDTGGTSDGGGTTGLTGFDSASAGETQGTGQDEEDGCGCRTDEGDGSLLGLVFGLLGLPLLRRRRR